MLAVVGHNSSNYGQLISELDEGTSRMKPPARTGRFPFFKFYPRDWLESTRHMTLEERGAYIDVICILMEMEGHLANDDDWMRHQLHIPKQRWRKMKGKLLDHEKIRIEDGCIVNDRCVKELADLMGKREQNSKNVQKRWEKVQEKSEQSSKKVETFSPEKSKKPSKNNDSDDTNVSLRALAKDSDLEEERKKDTPTQPSSCASEKAGVGEVEGINGATALIVSKLAGWINPIMPDYRTARGWLESSVAMYGGVVVRDSFAELEAKVMQGDVVARPIPLLTKICQRRKAAQPGKSSSPTEKPPGMSDLIWKKIQEDEARAKANGGIALW